MLNTRAGISDQTIQILSEICREKKPSKLVDLGTGAGYSLKTMIDAVPAAQIWTVESNAVYVVDVEMTLRLLVDLSRVTFIHSPIVAPPEGSKARGWYKKEPLDAIPSGIDILFVDGPEGTHGRHPALPIFLSRMARPSIVFLDDCNRAEERGILEDWGKLLEIAGIPYKTTFMKTDRGLGRIDLLVNAPMG